MNSPLPEAVQLPPCLTFDMTTTAAENRKEERVPHVGAALRAVETAFYVVVAMFLLVAGVVVIVGTVIELVNALVEVEPLFSVALTLIEEALLLVIVGELLYTLQLVLSGEQLRGEPFLLIGLVATVRRVVVVTAEVESLPDGGRELTNFLFELGLLGVLTLSFAGAILLLRQARGTQEVV